MPMKAVIIHTIIPTAEAIKGYISTSMDVVSKPFFSYFNCEADTTNAAHVASAKEPNKSAPMPAISPTLSPTLSAIVAGFLGLSSGRSCSSFPTRSAPTSAALVYIPPPTLANKATVEPPNP